MLDKLSSDNQPTNRWVQLVEDNKLSRFKVWPAVIDRGIEAKLVLQVATTCLSHRDADSPTAGHLAKLSRQ